MGNMLFNCALQCAYNALKNQPAADDNLAGPAEGNVHVIIIALDYPGTGNELTCTKDGDAMQRLCSACGVSDVIAMYNNDGNKDAILSQIEQVGSRCAPGDYFIFYYSGHGTSVPDTNGDEEDGKDEAYCTVTAEGELDWSAFLTDDDLADAFSSFVDDEVKVILLSDCCHSGTIADFNGADWGSKQAISISGCLDSQTSGDTGNGGIFTHSLTEAIAELSDNDVSCSQIYNATLEKDNDMYDSAQDITLAWSNALSGANEMAWPLCPAPGTYGGF